MNKFNLHDQVILKTGGAVMTISVVASEFNTYVCAWHDANLQPQTETYHESMLLLVSSALNSTP